VKKALDLFCRDGGASVGLFYSGFEVHGVDIADKKDYPFHYIQKNVFELERKFLEGFDFIWSSPPCQAYTYGTQWCRNKGKEYPDLVDKTRKLLEKTKKPFVIENVPGSPIRKDLVLCGEMFGMSIIRHRHFELHGFHVPQLRHIKHDGKVDAGTKLGIYNRSPHFERYAKTHKRKFTIAGHQNGTKLEWQQAMKAHWITTKKGLAQAVPPPYAEYIGRQYLKPKITLDAY